MVLVGHPPFFLSPKRTCSFLSQFMAYKNKFPIETYWSVPLNFLQRGFFLPFRNHIHLLLALQS